MRRWRMHGNNIVSLLSAGVKVITIFKLTMLL